ncbi:MAG TPA: hypothetical protein VF115_00745 [Acidimicrobiia bacterium]
MSDEETEKSTDRILQMVVDSETENRFGYRPPDLLAKMEKGGGADSNSAPEIPPPTAKAEADQTTDE